LRPEPATRPKSEVHESIMVMDLTLISWTVFENISVIFETPVVTICTTCFNNQ
jgi:hypothetical protein